MTITIGNVWQFLGCLVLAVLVLGLALGVAVMAAWSPSRVTRVVGFTVAGGITACAVILVMAGGGWL